MKALSVGTSVAKEITIICTIDSQINKLLSGVGTLEMHFQPMFHGVEKVQCPQYLQKFILVSVYFSIFRTAFVYYTHINCVAFAYVRTRWDKSSSIFESA